MNFLMINSVNSYVKGLDMKNRWSQKKEKADFSEDYTLNERQRKNEMFKKSYMEQRENDNEDKTLSAINNKVAVGSKLTPDEMKYLQVKNPALYQKLKDIEKEKKQYEEDLKKCKTKEDVDKLKMSKISSSLSAINSVKNNPNIPESKKLEIAAQEQRRLNELGEIEAKFIKSGEYAKLPTEEEKAKAEKDMREAEENITDVKPDKTAEEKTVSKSGTESEDKKDIPESRHTEKVAASTDKTDREKKLTVTEAELTPEAKKVKRARAKSAYRISDDSSSEHQVIFNTKG